MDMKSITINRRQLEAAHHEYRRIEPRDLFYQVAIELLDLSIKKKTKVSVSEAVAVLLQTWNNAHYRYHPFTPQHFSDIEQLITKWDALARFRNRSITDIQDQDKTKVEEVFCEFEKVLYPVGTAKAMHLLAPRFFPIWDRAIAKSYGIPLRSVGKNASAYFGFMLETKRQVDNLGGEVAIGRNPLKAIDEFNFCVFTKTLEIGYSPKIIRKP
jgi:hypothetical protein